MNCDQDIIAYAVAQGWLRPGEPCQNLTAGKYRKAATAIRPMRKKVSDGMTAAESRVATSRFGWRRVPAEVAQENEDICRACPNGKFMVLKGGEPVCNICQCSAKWLEAKWKDPKQRCPYGHWDNPKRLVMLTVTKGGGDAQQSTQ